MAVTSADVQLDSATTARPSFHMPSLDGLRAASFALVFIGHGGLPSVSIPVPGGFGVTVFFFLSGFLITTLLRLERANTQTVSLKKFYLRRALRILPPFYLVLTAALIASMAWGLSDRIDPFGTLAQALHYANYWIIEHDFNGLPVGTGVFWSLAVEEHFYLLFPFVFILLARHGGPPAQQAMWLFGACGVLLAWRLYLASTLDLSAQMNVVRLEIASDTRFDSLLFGCALALHGNPSLDSSSFDEQTWKYVLLPLAIAGLVASFAVRDEMFRATFRYTLQGICLIPVFVCAIRYPDWLVNRPLNFRPVAFLGTLSYSLYLVHQVVIAVVEKEFSDTMGSTMRGLITFSICLAIAWLIYIAVEKPCAQLRRRLRA